MDSFSDFYYFDHGCVVSFGNFDGVHHGHLSVLSTLKKTAENLQLPSVAITFEPHPMEFLCGKTNFRIMRSDEKISHIKNAGIDTVCVIPFDYAFSMIGPEDFLKILVKKMNAKYIVVSEKCAFGRGSAGDISLIEDLSQVIGYDFITADILNIRGIPCSSSAIRTLIKAGEVTKVKDFLGRNYSVTGIVMRGDGIASSKLSCPTANILVDELLPKLGVYVVELDIESIPGKFFGVANVGMRPTFRKISNPLIEVHILDFDNDIYGEKISVHFLEFIREEIKFDSLESLSKQILLDIKHAISVKSETL